MTSKEALWEIFETAFRQGNVVVDLREQHERVLSDLEVLEILKNKKVDIVRLSMCDCVAMYNCYYKCSTELQLTEEEFNKIKEWLERK